METIYGNKALKKTFKSYSDYVNYCKENKKGLNENNVTPIVQFLSERYYKIKEEDLSPPNLKTYSIDIEVHTPGKFPNPKDVEYPIVLISVTDCHNGKIYCFGEKELTKAFKEYEYDYFHCKTEENLLKSFYSWWSKNYPDVVTGWNITADFKINRYGGFDFPYIINRTKKLFGEKTTIYRKLSPINIVSMYYKPELDSYITDIAGVSVIDYMALYKWYTSKNLESDALETVAQHELDEGKLENEGLAWLYDNDWNKYVEYNMIDTLLIKRLEDKLKYIKLAQSLSLLCKCTLKMYSSTTNLIEGLLLTRYRRDDKCAPFFSGGTAMQYPAAYVKEPYVGKYGWLFSLDITSSYPFAIVTCNMSPETLYGKILDMPDDTVVACMEKREFPEIRINKKGEVKKLSGKNLKTFNMAIKKKIFSVAPNGVVFYNKPIGVYPKMEKDVYLKRKETKKKMALKYKEYEKTKDPKAKQEAENLFTSQWAQKIIINGAYGLLATPYSRYFSPYIAEAVTAVGRYSLKSGEMYINQILNNDNKDLKEILGEIEKN